MSRQTEWIPSAEQTPALDFDFPSVDGSEPVVTTANDEAVYSIGYHGIRRYLRVAITAAGGTTPTLLCAATVIRGHGRVKP